MKSYSQFLKSINESSGKNYIDVFNEDKPFGPPAFLVHRKEIIPELQNLIDKKERGLIQKIVVFANIPTSGKRKPEYLADVLPTIHRERTPDDRPEDDEPDETNVFIDVEFEVVGLDAENNKVIGAPISLKKKNITTPIDPIDIHEISFKKTEKTEKLPPKIRGKILANLKDLPPEKRKSEINDYTEETDPGNVYNEEE